MVATLVVRLVLRLGSGKKNQKMGRNQSPQRVFKFKLGKLRSSHKCKEQHRDDSGTKLKAGGVSRGQRWGGPRQWPESSLDSQQLPLLAVH